MQENDKNTNFNGKWLTDLQSSGVHGTGEFGDLKSLEPYQILGILKIKPPIPISNLKIFISVSYHF